MERPSLCKELSSFYSSLGITIHLSTHATLHPQRDPVTG